MIGQTSLTNRWCAFAVACLTTFRGAGGHGRNSDRVGTIYFHRLDSTAWLIIVDWSSKRGGVVRRGKLFAGTRRRVLS